MELTLFGAANRLEACSNSLWRGGVVEGLGAPLRTKPKQALPHKKPKEQQYCCRLARAAQPEGKLHSVHSSERAQVRGFESAGACDEGSCPESALPLMELVLGSDGCVWCIQRDSGIIVETAF